MSIIKIENLTFSYNYMNIFEDVNLNLDISWKLGLIGRNGRGKTTFLKLLLGIYEYKGNIMSDIEFEYFPYDNFNKKDLVINIAKEICPNIYEWELKKEFSKLSLDNDILYKQFDIISNGEQTKVLLSILFLKNNSFLLIDEPTNYLDLKSRIIISEYLKNKNGFIVVSHDRMFLDSIIDHVLVINKHNIEIQKGNFSSWYENKKLEDNFELNSNIKLKKEIKRLSKTAKQKEVWSNKIEGTKYRTTNSGVSVDRGYIGRKSASMMKLSKNIENRQNKMIDDKKNLLKNIDEEEPLKIFPLVYYKNKLVEFDKVTIIYDKIVCSNVSFDILNGDRVQIIGQNGSGKSSILKLILGYQIKYTGNLKVGSNLKISYVSQNTFDVKGTMKEFINLNVKDESLFKTILKKLGFTSNDFEKNLDDYSEGMKKKILLAKSLCEKAHLYIWDESLNYIDVISRIQIENVILEYKPTMIFVEHDKEFSSKLATKIIKLRGEI